LTGLLVELETIEVTQAFHRQDEARDAFQMNI
jgi:hypothetical protein